MYLHERHEDDTADPDGQHRVKRRHGRAVVRDGIDRLHGRLHELREILPVDGGVAAEDVHEGGQLRLRTGEVEVFDQLRQLGTGITDGRLPVREDGVKAALQTLCLREERAHVRGRALQAVEHALGLPGDVLDVLREVTL